MRTGLLLNSSLVREMTYRKTMSLCKLVLRPDYN